MTITQSVQERSFNHMTSEESRQLAKDNNWDVVTPADDELFIDCDSLEEYQAHCRLYDLAAYHQNSPLASLFDALPVCTPSKSGEGYHVRIKLTKPLSDVYRVALQSSLGSDPRAGLSSVNRILNGDPDPILFFELKQKLISTPAEPKLLEAPACTHPPGCDFCPWCGWEEAA